jgi:hypothetical protein
MKNEKIPEREAIAQIFSKKITDHGRMLSILWKKTYSGAHYKIICQKNQLNSACLALESPILCGSQFISMLTNNEHKTGEKTQKETIVMPALPVPYMVL